jgi:16S rRNA U516 pseudouridylate synthase RsuA-like enzyme
LEEGKKRHIRRIFSAMRYHVVDLLRIKEWSHDLGDLQEWQWKTLGM